MDEALAMAELEEAAVRFAAVARADGCGPDRAFASGELAQAAVHYTALHLMTNLEVMAGRRTNPETTIKAAEEVGD